MAHLLYPHFRIFRGIRFHVAWEWKTKEEADESAQGYRKMGYFAQVAGSRNIWVVYVKKKGRK